MHLILCNIVFPNSITLIKKKEKGFFFFLFFRETENGFGGPSQVAAMTEMKLDGRHPEFILEFILDSWSGNNVS